MVIQIKKKKVKLFFLILLLLLFLFFSFLFFNVEAKALKNTKNALKNINIISTVILSSDNLFAILLI